MTSANRSRNSRHAWCALWEEDNPTCEGRHKVVLTGPDGQRQRVCPGHAAALWLTDPTLRFAAETRPEAIAAVMRQAFGGSR